jgi:hypothetical protein
VSTLLIAVEAEGEAWDNRRLTSFLAVDRDYRGSRRSHLPRVAMVIQGDC